MIGRLVDHMKWPGRRGIVLIFFGFIYLVTGQAWLTAPPTPSALVNMYIILSIATLKFWSFTWLAVGLLMFLGSLYRRAEFWAFGIPTTLATFWGLCFLLAAPPMGHGTGRAYVAMVTYFGFAFFLQVIAGWPEPKQVLLAPPPLPNMKRRDV